MGGCCSTSKQELNSASIYTYCPEVSNHGPLSRGLLVIQNLDTSIPESFRAPPLPLPFSMALSSSNNFETNDNKSGPVLVSGHQSLDETLTHFEGLKNLKFADDLIKDGYSKSVEDKSSAFTVYTESEMEEDVCPTCLEEYDEDNPRIITKCQHHFHLSCIFEWMERSDTCPICDQLMVIDQTEKK